MDFSKLTIILDIYMFKKKDTEKLSSLQLYVFWRIWENFPLGGNTKCVGQTTSCLYVTYLWLLDVHILADWSRLRAKSHVSVFSRESLPLSRADHTVLPVCVGEQRFCCSTFVLKKILL